MGDSWLKGDQWIHHFWDLLLVVSFYRPIGSRTKLCPLGKYAPKHNFKVVAIIWIHIFLGRLFDFDDACRYTPVPWIRHGIDGLRKNLKKRLQLWTFQDQISCTGDTAACPSKKVRRTRCFRSILGKIHGKWWFEFPQLNFYNLIKFFGGFPKFSRENGWGSEGEGNCKELQKPRKSIWTKLVASGIRMRPMDHPCNTNHEFVWLTFTSRAYINKILFHFVLGSPPTQDAIVTTRMTLHL